MVFVSSRCPLIIFETKQSVKGKKKSLFQVTVLLFVPGVSAPFALIKSVVILKNRFNDFGKKF